MSIPRLQDKCGKHVSTSGRLKGNGSSRTAKIALLYYLRFHSAKGKYQHSFDAQNLPTVSQLQFNLLSALATGVLKIRPPNSPYLNNLSSAAPLKSYPNKIVGPQVYN